MITTRSLDLYSPDQFHGICFFSLDFCPSDQRLRILDSTRFDPSSSLSLPSSSTTSLLIELFDTCTSWGELNLLARYLHTQTIEVNLLKGLLALRKAELLSCPRWVSDHVNDSWVSISLLEHLGSLTSCLLSFETFSLATKHRYLSLALLPSGVVFPLQFMMMIWGIKSQQECLELLDLFSKRGLISTVSLMGIGARVREGEIAHRLYTLSPLHAHLLILLLLREQTKEPTDDSFFSSFLICTMCTSPATSTTHLSASLQSSLNNVLTALLEYLTNQKKFSALPTYRLSKYLVYWRRLYL
jgi:hypothetical protein